MANQEDRIKIVIDAEDKAKGAISSVNKGLDDFKNKVDDMQPAFKKMAAIGSIAFAAISAEGVTALKAFSEAQKEMAVAGQAVNNTLETMSVKQLNKLQEQVGLGVDVFDAMKKKMEEVGAAALKLGFDDEEASKAFAKLFQVTGDATQAQKDLNLAMDLAAFSGRGLEESASAITKVHAGATRVLKEFGIEVKEGATDLEALAILQTKVGGSAATMADTFDVKMKIMRNALGNLQEGIGAALAPAIMQILTIIQPFLDKIVTWAEENPKLAATILLVVAGLTGLLTIIGLIGMALPALTAGFALLAGATGIGAIIIGVTLLIAGIAYLITHWDRLKVQILNAVMPALTALKTWFDNVKKSGSDIANAIATTWTTGWKSLGDIINNVIEKVKAAIEWFNKLAAVQAIKSVGAGIGNAIGGLFGRASGGSVQEGRSFLVGEHGPEMFTPGYGGGRITPLGAGGGINIVITGNSFISPDDFAEKVGDDLIKVLQQNIKL